LSRVYPVTSKLDLTGGVHDCSGDLPADPDNDNIYYLHINSGSGAVNRATALPKFDISGKLAKI
jgi:hypothetical protein